MPPAVSTLYTCFKPTLPLPAPISARLNQSTAPTPGCPDIVIPTLALLGALISATFLEKSFSPVIERSKTGVPLEAKRWNPNTGKEERPGMVRGVFATRALVRGCVAAIRGIWEVVGVERNARAVISKSVATAPRAMGGEERLVWQV